MKKVMFFVILMISGMTTFAQTLESIITPEIKAMAEKLGYEITLQGKHPMGGFNIEVSCPSLNGSQAISGVDSCSVKKDGFTFTRNVDLDKAEFDYGKVLSVSTDNPGVVTEKRKTRSLSNVIDKTTYVFTQKSVVRIVTMKDGSSDKEQILP